MMIRLQDGDYELRYELMSDGTFRSVEFQREAPTRMVEHVPPHVAMDNFKTVLEHKFNFKLEEIARDR